MRRLAIALSLLLACTLPPARAAAGDARRALDEGLVLFAAKNYEQAAVKFQEAAEAAGAEGLDPETAAYDRGNALLLAGKPDEAAAAFATAVRSGDGALREKAHFNRGNALVAAGDARAAAADAGAAIALYGQALDEYESAMRLAPGDLDPKVNHELAARKRAQLAGQQEKQRGSGRPDEGSRPPQERQSRPGGQMSPDEALTLLEAVRQREASQRRQRPSAPDAREPVGQDW